jgi:hypothetical protein
MIPFIFLETGRKILVTTTTAIPETMYLVFLFFIFERMHLGLSKFHRIYYVVIKRCI